MKRTRVLGLIRVQNLMFQMLEFWKVDEEVILR